MRINENHLWLDAGTAARQGNSDNYGTPINVRIGTTLQSERYRAEVFCGQIRNGNILFRNMATAHYVVCSMPIILPRVATSLQKDGQLGQSRQPREWPENRSEPIS